MQDNDGIIFNILIVIGLAGLLLVSAVLEKYTNCLHGYIIAFLAAVLAACIATACVISVRYLLGLIIFGFAIGFITQTIGTTSDMWCYDYTFIFAALSWSLAAVTMEGISKAIRYPMKELTDKPLNVLIIIIIFAIIPIMLAVQDHWKYAKYRPIPYKKSLEKEKCCPNSKEAEKPSMKKAKNCFCCPEDSELPQECREPNVPFWVYYVSLLIFAIAMNHHIRFTELLSLILAAWIMGGLSEFIGAKAHLWYFRTETWPPLFLVFGCWPLEFLVIRGLALRINGLRK